LTGLSAHETLPAIVSEGLWHSPLIPATLFAVGIWSVQLITGSPLAAPVGALLWLGVEAAAYLELIDRQLLDAAGWVLADLPESKMWLAVQAVTVTSPDFSAIAGFSAEIISVSGVAALAIPLNATGLEVDGTAEADLDREYLASGVANLGVAAIGGLPSNLSLNRSIMNHQAGAQTRLSGLVVALTYAGAALFAADPASAVPGPVLGGLILFMGGSLLWRWLAASAGRFTRPERLWVLAIFGLIVFYGYIAGAALGIVASCITFAITYSRTPFVRQRLSRSLYSSYVKRAPEDEQLLLENCARIQIFQLQGYIFFGTAHPLGQQVQRLIEDTPEPLSHLVLDFRHVTGAESSASFSLIKILQMLHRHRVRACFTSLTCTQAERMRAIMEENSDVDAPAIFDSLDFGLEWCEDEVVASLDIGGHDLRDAHQWLADELGGHDLADRLIPRMRRQQVQPGGVICRQDDASDLMLFVVRGHVSVILERTGEIDLRLRSVTEKTVIGEIGFYKGGPLDVRQQRDCGFARIRRAAAVGEEIPRSLRALWEISPIIKNS